MILFALGLAVLRNQTGRPRATLAAVLLLAVGVDYKAHGTRKRFNASIQDPSYRPGEFPHLDAAVYRQLHENNVYRVAVEPTSPFPQTLRHFGLVTPQGFDPFLTGAYKLLTRTLGTFRSNWEFDLSPSRSDGLDTLGVRFFLTTEQGPSFRELSVSPRFRLIGPATSYFKAFERIEAKPPYGWARDGTDIGVRRSRWEPERREFMVRTDTGGAFYLAEQWNPGWSAQIDGVPAPVERWPGQAEAAFQSVTVPAGEHFVAFRYAEPRLRIGAWISAITLLGVGLAVRGKRV
jgi:hypothetical protein